jgi:hypothetical protein
MALLLVHAAATWAMTGLIWFVQIVHYPLLARVGGDAVGYARAHAERRGWVVGPPMLVEAAAALWLAAAPPAGVSRGLALGGGAVLAAVWLSTGVVQVPLHGRLQGEVDAPTRARLVRRLVATNWVRTVGWTLRAALAAALLLR